MPARAKELTACAARDASAAGRLTAAARPHRVDAAVKDVARQTAVLHGRSRRALGSTVLDDAVATQDTVTQLGAAIRTVRKLIPEAREVHVTAHDYDRGGKPDIALDDEVARGEAFDACADLDHMARDLVAEDHRLLEPDRAEAAVVVVVQV